MNRTAKRLLLLLCVALAACLCAGCGSGKKPQAHTRGYDTPENLAAFQASGLFETAKGYSEYRTSSEYDTPKTVIGDYWDVPPYFIDTHAPGTAPLSPFVAVVVRTDDDKNQIWSVCGGTAEQMDLDGVRTLVVCVISERHAQYEGDKRLYTGTSESATLLYIDAQTGAFLMESEIKGKDLPNRAYGGAPRYTLDDDKLVAQVQRDMTAPFTLSEDGEITDGAIQADAFSRNPNGYAIPEGVKRITRLKVDPSVPYLALPASLEAVADGAIPRSASLVVPRGSCAETFARENGYAFKYAQADLQPGDRNPWRICVDGCEYPVYEDTRDFPVRPDGDYADALRGRVLVVTEGSAAEAYAKAHQYLYSTVDQSRIYAGQFYPNPRFCIDGSEWAVCDDNHQSRVRFPDSAAPGDAAFDWAVEFADVAFVTPGSPAEAACREAGLECRYGSFDCEEKTWTDDNGVEWRIDYSHRSDAIVGIHVPAEYPTVYALESFDDLRDPIIARCGGDKNRWTPIWFIQPGSELKGRVYPWAEEGSAVLHFSGVHNSDSFDADYADGIIEQIENWDPPHWDDISFEKDVYTRLNHGFKAIYTEEMRNNYSWLFPFCVSDDLQTMTLRTKSQDRWHLNNGRTLKGIQTLQIEGDPALDELCWIAQRATEEEPFLLRVQEGTRIADYAREHDLPFEIWTPEAEVAEN